jgi:transposase-like protein
MHPSGRFHWVPCGATLGEAKAAKRDLARLAGTFGIAAVARELGLSQEAVRKWVQEHRRPVDSRTGLAIRRRLSLHEKKQILDLLAHGLSLAKVAKIVGRSTRTIFEVKHNPPPAVRNLAQLRQLERQPPKTFDELSDIGKRCLESFELFSYSRCSPSGIGRVL